MDKIPSFIESICIKNGKIQLLQYHNQRANAARSSHSIREGLLDFGKCINTDKAIHATTKCRIVYGQKIEKIEYLPYTLKPINSLKTINIEENWSYEHKYLDRSKLEFYFNQKEDADDIIMIQSGFVTDSYYCNLAFLKNGLWYTPTKPLLPGTKRAYLLSTKQILETDIPIDKINSYESVRLFNAMIDFGQIELSTRAIF